MSNTVTCVFVHGWAMNSAVWHDCVELLPEWINVVMVDLPGHGTMAEVSAASLDDYVQALVPLVHRPVIWVGWSLGGLAVLRLAELYPQRVAAALLVATNPCFVSQPDWSSAVDKAVFQQFAKELSVNQEKTIRRFVALQANALIDKMSVVKQLQQSIAARGQASTQALNTGLKILLETDLRASLSNIEAPLHWVFGGKDALVPPQLAERLSNDYGQENVSLLPTAGHAPFLSEQELFIQQLLTLATQLRDNKSVRR